MSRFKQIQHPRDNPELESLYKEAMEVGFVGSGGDTPNNLFTALSERPDFLAATLALTKNVLLQGALPPAVRQMIGLTISIQNNCRYCMEAYTHALEAMGVPTEVIQSCANDPDLTRVPPAQRAIIKFGLKAARDAKSVLDEDFQALRDYGLSDGEIMEVIMMAATANFLDLWADMSRIQADGEEES